MVRAKKKAKKRSVPALKPAPLHYDEAWGYEADSLEGVLDWSRLTAAFDELVAPKLWSMGVAHASVSSKLQLFLQPSPKGCRRVSLLAAAGGEAAAAASSSSSSSSAGAASAAASDATTSGLAEHPRFLLSTGVALRQSPGKGRGWFATKQLPAGTPVLIEKPIVASLDAEWRGQPWSQCASADTAALGMQLARNFSPSVGALLAPFHPQLGAVPELPSDSEDEEEAELLEHCTSQVWAAVRGLDEEAKERLQAVVRLNSLGFYTHSEQLCHHGNFNALTGSGIFALASGFNHSCDPSVARYSLGDVTVFVTNRPVDPGTELCISYIEAELLCAPLHVRRESLNRDFQCACPRCSAEAQDLVADSPRPKYLHVDEQLQAQLSLLLPADRLETVDAVLRGEMGGDSEGEEEEVRVKDDEEPEEGAASGSKKDSAAKCVVLGKDAQELRVVKALAYMQRKKFGDALEVWRQLAAFTCHHCPPFDEGLAVYATQAALCALECEDAAMAAKYAALAKACHRVSCGADLFTWRYQKEVESSMASPEAQQAFWGLPGGPAGGLGQGFAEVVQSWGFREEEVPKALQ